MSSPLRYQSDLILSINLVKLTPVHLEDVNLKFTDNLGITRDLRKYLFFDGSSRFSACTVADVPTADLFVALGGLGKTGSVGAATVCARRDADAIAAAYRNILISSYIMYRSRRLQGDRRGKPEARFEGEFCSCVDRKREAEPCFVHGKDSMVFARPPK